MSDLFSATYNPDVLSCLANLSNDEVFTPPEVVNQMLDMLPKEIWNDKNATFLDPACKSGVFLREIAKRLIEAQLPNYEQISYEINEKLRAGGELDGRDIAFQHMLEDVIEHVFKNQIFGIAITELTSLLSRRSVYCSKYPQSEYSVVRFDNPEGCIDYKQMQHTWKNGKCAYCGASEGEYDREEGKEQYAYEFIHLNNPEEVFDMKFDVIIGNPPYQMSDGGGEGSSAMPIYDKFIQQAMKLNPRYLAMIVPARWYSGGKGLDAFRQKMLSDTRFAIIHDFQETELCFPGLNIRGGVCYFLWEREHEGDCYVINHFSDKEDSCATRPLLEKGAETFIRQNQAVGILKKVRSLNETTYGEAVWSRNPFGIPSNYDGWTEERSNKDDLVLYRSRRGSTKDKVVYIKQTEISKNIEAAALIKVLVSKASPGGDEIPHAIISEPIIAPPGSVCTETYLIVDTPGSASEAENLITYMKTKFFRFMMSLVKNTQNISRSSFVYVPRQDLSHTWSDEELYEKYGITEEEQAFIDSLIKPMDLGD